MLPIKEDNLLKIEGIPHLVIVVSNNYFNQAGKVIVCPILKKTIPGSLYIELKEPPVEGFELCEQIEFMNLVLCWFNKLMKKHSFDIMNISDAMASIF